MLAIEALEHEVNNGGYNQFFVNSSVEYAPCIVEALRRIGCPKTAAITQDAIATLRLPVIAVAETEKIIHVDDDRRNKALSKCDGRFFERPESIEDRLFTFIKANKRKINF